MGPQAEEEVTEKWDKLVHLALTAEHNYSPVSHNTQAPAISLIGSWQTLPRSEWYKLLLHIDVKGMAWRYSL